MRLPFSNKAWFALSIAATCMLAATPGWADNSVAVATTSGTTAAATTTNTTAASGTSATDTVSDNTLTLAKAIEIGLQSNSSLRSLRLQIDSADTNAILVNSQIKKISADDIDSLDAAKSKYYKDQQNKMSQQINDLSYKATESKTKLQIQKLFYDCLNAQSELDQQQRSAERIQKNLDMVNAKLKAGTVPKTDLLSAQVSVTNAKASLLSAQNAVTVAFLNLNNYLGVDLDKKWTLVNETQLTKPTIGSLDEALKQAGEKRYEIQQKQNEIQLAELNVELFQKYSALSTYQGSMAKNDLESANIDLEDTKRGIEVEVKQAYFNMEASRSSVDMYKESQAMAEENFRAAQIRYENGLSTSLDVVQAEEELTKTENQYNKAVNSANISVVTFQNAIGE
ncbi:UNVERIFIED_CONTAM: outer membrane protein TolC [Brevibacillus sp. OAP136]